ncbi:porin family protein [Pararhodonellum marinum]|uniref:DUF2490 domain-containing protein n=1 Tax=Pararhodonellum marinum TaxID=2755358 RepID=UPI00188FC776|nr:DUF2490 domain-containing protein [Pararhodonellum marinum]
MNIKSLKFQIFRCIVVSGLFFSTHTTLKAQQDISFNYETWWGVMTSAQVAPQWSVWNDAHFVDQLFFIYRTGLTYHNKKDNIVGTAGYGWLRLTAPFSEGSLVRTEHRPWGQVIFRVPSTKKVSTSFRFRYDARFIRNVAQSDFLPGYSFNHRWRFNNALRYNWGNLISPNTRFTNSFLNEALFTTGPGSNGFRHEHRTHFLAGLAKGNINYSIGYVIRYINLSPEIARINHGMVFWVTINFNLMKGKLPTIKEFPGDHVD